MGVPAGPHIASGSRASATAALLASSLFSLLAVLPAPATAVTTVAIVAPIGGEMWSGGTVHDIIWDLGTDTNNDVDVEYLVGGVPTLIEIRAFLIAGRYTTSWIVPNQDLTNVTARVCATDAVPIECDTSAPFDIDGTVPLLTSRSPEGSNVGLAELIDLQFSERMNRTKVETAFSIDPGVANLTFSKLAGNGLRVGHDPFLPGRTYTVALGCGATDESDPGNAVSGCPIVWSFTTATPPAITLASPAGGEVWSGGSPHEIRWTASDAEDPTDSLQIYLESSFDAGPWTLVAGPLAGEAAYVWTVPSVDVTVARLRARAVDTRGLNATATSPPFVVDSAPPRVASVTPPAESVGNGWDDPIVVRFDEPVVGALGPATFGLRDASGRWVPGTLAWDAPSQFRVTPSAPLRAFTRYTGRVNATLRDTSDPGNPMAAPFEWTFATKLNSLPVIAFDFTVDPVLSGGFTWAVSWSASDVDDDPSALAVYVEFSDGGAFSPVAGPLPATHTFPWTVPAVDTPLAVLLVRVVDSQGGTASDSVTFAIDAIPPRILTALPAAGALDVPPDADLLLSFSEPVTGTANLVGLRDATTLAWTDVVAIWDDPTTLRVRPAGLLREMVVYEVVVNGTARDVSSPGHGLAATSWTFRVAAFPPALSILQPAPGTRWTAGSAQTIRVRAMDGRDPSVTVSADLAPDGVAFLPFLAPTAVANGEAAFPVTAPSVDAPNGVLRICAADAAGATTCASVAVAIDATRPRLLQSVPAAGTKQVHPESPLVLTFSESMSPATVEASFALTPSTPLTFRWARTLVDNDTMVVDHPRLLELRTYTAALGCPAKDASAPGLPLAGACPVAWTFATAATPEVHLLYPIGGERLTAGVAQPIWWIASEEEGVVRVSVALSFDGGLTFPTPLLSWEPFAVGDTRTERAMPAVAANAVLRVTVQDSLGLTATATSPPFALDPTPPTLLSASPPNGATDVSPLEDLVLVFSESMDPATAYALAVTPALRDAVTSWSATNVPFDTLRIQHSSIRLGTTMTIAIDGMRDASRPGNFLRDRVSFTVLPDRQRPTVSLSIDAEATAGDVVVLDASASSDNDEIVEYTWTIRDATGRVVARRTGPRVEYRALKPGIFNVTAAVIDAAGNRAEASAALRVHTLGTTAEAALPPAVPMLGWLALGGGGAAVYGLTDRGRSFFTRLLVLPLYVKLRPEKVLDHETRGMIRGYILVHPGDCYTDVKRNLGLANGELAYHLGVLEREGIIRSVTKGAKRVYYPADVPIPADGGGMHEVQRRLLLNIEEVPGMSVRDLASLLGISSQLALYHVRKLGEEGFVQFERHGVKLRVYPTTPEERRKYRERMGT